MYLGLLALEAYSCPISDILANARQYVPGGDQPLGNSNTGVGEGV